eukprot:GHVO01014675.1.p1 GENE.GHVO01014675.1~~GHVO01014675.1.p1  ORF type:complete len:1028 (+),score=209.00 GHVO01014675.1:116-3199(+)
MAETKYWDENDPSNLKEKIGNIAVKAISTEKDGNAKRRAADLVASLAGIAYEKQPDQYQSFWLYLSSLFETSAADPTALHLCLCLLSRIVEYPVLLVPLEASAANLSRFMTGALAAVDKGVLAEAVRTWAALVDAVSKSSPRHRGLQSAVHQLSSTVVDALPIVATVQDAKSIFDDAATATESDVAAWKGCEARLVEVAGNIAIDSSLDAGARKASLQLLCSLICEPRTQTLQHVPYALDICLKLVATAPMSPPGWDSKREDDPVDEVEMEMSNSGIDGLVRLIKIEDKSVTAHVLASIQTWTFGTPDPSHVYAALHALAILVSEKWKQITRMHPERDELIVAQCLSIARHEMPMIRYTSLFVLGEVITAGSTHIQPEAGLVDVLGHLIDIARNETSTRCINRSLASLCLIFENIEEEGIVAPALLEEMILHAVVPALEMSNTETKELGLALASALASVSGSAFVPYYDRFMTAVKNVLNNRQKHAGLIENAISLAGNLGIAVGKDLFIPDSDFIIRQVLEYLGTPELGQGFNETMLQTLTLSAETLGPLFCPYLELIMPRMLEMASRQIKAEFREEVVPSDRISGNLSYCEEGGQVSVVLAGREGRNIMTIDTEAVEFKVAALRTIEQIAAVLVDDFRAYAEQMWDMIILQLSDNFRACRKGAFNTLGSIVGCMLPENVVAKARPMIEAFVFNMKRYDYEQVSLYMLNPLQSVLGVMQKGIPSDPTTNWEELLIKPLLECFASCLKSALTKEFGVPTEEEEDDDDDDPEGLVYDGVMQNVGILLKTFGPKVSPYIEQYIKAPYTAMLGVEEVNMSGRVAALCIFSDYIEYGGELAIPIAADFLPVALVFARCNETDDADNDDDVLRVQAASYGVGVVCHRVPQVFGANRSALKDEIIPTLEAVLSHPNARTEDRRPASDCAACALLKIYLTYTADIGAAVSASLSSLISDWYPLTTDVQEAHYAHGMILRDIVIGQCQAAPWRKDKLIREILLNLCKQLCDDQSLLSESTIKSQHHLEALKLLAHS